MIQFRSDIRVKAVPDGCCGSDRLVACAAWADDPDELPPHRDDTPKGWGNVIRPMVRLHHTSPFEKGKQEVFLTAPGVVWWQLTRHRFMSIGGEDFAFNIESGRYKVLDGVFYVPPPDRPCLEPVGFRPLRPRFDSDDETWAAMAENVRQTATAAWESYESQIDRGVAREVARLCLPNWSLYCSGYVGGNPLTWLKFFEKRDARAAVGTFPQWEIEQVSRACEDIFAARWPLTHAAFVEFGRSSP